MRKKHGQMHYDFKSIEAKWQKRWDEQQTFRSIESFEKPKYYSLVFFPYPSGAGISVGHCRNYIPVDVLSRLKAMQGYNVLHPMGWDAFGQPAENEAIKKERNPREMVSEYAANYTRQMKMVGLSYDWSREINSSHPNYYRWTQWFFLLLHRRGLAYRSTTPISWCPSCKTGLANEEVVAGTCWRCGTSVEKRPMPQWYFRITAYADRLIAGLDNIQWPEGIKAMQREWIGRREGAEIEFCIEGRFDLSPLRVFTTRPDTIWGVTFVVVAPDHPILNDITTSKNRKEVELYAERAQRVSEMNRLNTKRAKTGVFTGTRAINPINGEAVPIFVADYVLLGSGTGAVMGVPAHDQRDFEFAKEHSLPIRLVYKTIENQTEEGLIGAISSGGVMGTFPMPCIAEGGSDYPFSGLPEGSETTDIVITWLEKKGLAKRSVNYRLRDWLISRQRYWGAPIPIVHCPRCGAVPVHEKELPILLPEIDHYQPTGTGESPLASIPNFVDCACPTCGAKARRETDTMGGFACSSWYFLRFANPQNNRVPFDRKNIDYWLPVDIYSGGAEHAVMHLLYARFWTKVLFDEGMIGFDEPFQRLCNQGMLLALTPGRIIQPEEGHDLVDNWKVLKPEEKQIISQNEWAYRWVKMSKSMGNVVTPDEICMKYGADSLRIYTLFVAPFEDTVQWKDSGMEGAYRYIIRVWNLWHELHAFYRRDWRENTKDAANSYVEKLRRKLHQTIQRVGCDIEGFRFNTAVAALMELTNDISSFRKSTINRELDQQEATAISECVETLPLLLSPITPHLAEEMWESLGHSESIFRASWPTIDESAIAEKCLKFIIQINGKFRDCIEAPLGADESTVLDIALSSENVRRHLIDKTVSRTIFVENKVLNLITASSDS